MAVSAAFLERLRGEVAVPAELHDEVRPIVGCTGQINSTYDWPLIAEVVDRFSETLFAFVGPVFDEGPAAKSVIDAVFARPNVRWLGPQPHARLPEFLSRFTVCWNPLRVDWHSERRDPLRLYDYLATDRPALSADLGSARAHLPHLEVYSDVEDCVGRLRRMISPDYFVDRLPDNITLTGTPGKSELNSFSTISANHRNRMLFDVPIALVGRSPAEDGDRPCGFLHTYICIARLTRRVSASTF